jgi:hypothetical protein
LRGDQAVAGLVGTGCNWTIPGWTGDARKVRDCTEQIGAYLELLRAQFNIPEERSNGGR